MQFKVYAEERKAFNAEYRIDAVKIVTKTTDKVVTDGDGNKSITRTIVTIRIDEDGNETVLDTVTTQHEVKSTEEPSSSTGTAAAGH